MEARAADDGDLDGRQGRPAKIDTAGIGKLAGEGAGRTEIFRRMGISRVSVYRLLDVPSAG